MWNTRVETAKYNRNKTLNATYVITKVANKDDYTKIVTITEKLW